MWVIYKICRPRLWRQNPHFGCYVKFPPPLVTPTTSRGARVSPSTTCPRGSYSSLTSWSQKLTRPSSLNTSTTNANRALIVHSYTLRTWRHRVDAVRLWQCYYDVTCTCSGSGMCVEVLVTNLWPNLNDDLMTIKRPLANHTISDDAHLTNTGHLDQYTDQHYITGHVVHKAGGHFLIKKGHPYIFV